MAQPPYPPQPPYGQPPGYSPQGYYPPPQAGPPHGAPYPPPKKGAGGWLIAIFAILGAVILFGGVLAVLAIHGVRKYIAAAKTAEARNALGVIARDASIAYERERTSRSGAIVHRFCPSASRSVPTSVALVSGKKYQSSPAEWQVDAARNAGFACLDFSMSSPQYYVYSYKELRLGQNGEGFEATAAGDLNGDGVTSLFQITGAATASGTVLVAPNLVERDPEE